METPNENQTPKPEKFKNFLELKGSSRAVPKGTMVSSSNLNEVIDVTIRIRRKNAIEDFVSKVGKENKTLKRSEFADLYGASNEDIKLVEEYAHKHDLTIEHTSAARRTVKVKGTIQNISSAFKVHLADYKDENGKVFRGRAGKICIPAELAEIVVGVFGIDNRPQAKPMFHVAKNEIGHLLAPADSPSSYSPVAIAKAYGYPTDVNGAGQCIAIIELGGGFRSEDMSTYFASLNLPTPTIKAVSVDGAINSPSNSSSPYDGEVVLDIQVAGAVAPGANIVVYFANNNDQSF
jgi:kumamolisin